jgi:hypothetical protein
MTRMHSRLKQGQILMGVVVVLGGLAFSSCSFSTAIILVNNTGFTVIGKCDEGEPRVLRPGEEMTFHGLSAGIALEVVSANWKRRFPLDMKSSVPMDLLGKLGRQSLIVLQLQPDGLLYIVDGKYRRPAREIPAQPTGFPISTIIP